MKNLILMFGIVLVFGTTATAVDIAILTQSHWWSQSSANREMQEIVDNVVAAPVAVFTPSDHSLLADWVITHTGDGESDLLILCGQVPSSIYPGGNSQPDGSIAELFLDDGNCIVNTGDWIFYISAGGSHNESMGLPYLMDITSMEMWDDDLPITATAEGQEYTPSLTDFLTARAMHLDALENDWYAELVLGVAADGLRADPCILRNSVTGGRVGIFFQTAGHEDDPRGEVISEWINNWYLPTVANGNPFAWRPDPQSGSVVRKTAATLRWSAGDGATSHNVYFGESFDDVNEGLVEPVATTETTLDTGDIPGYAGGLTPGQTYYWRVDEINPANPDSPTKGAVWSFQLPPLTAWGPSPADGGIFVKTDATLSWEKGMNALFHVVYFGESYEDINAPATDPPGGVMTPDGSYAPTDLEEGKTYYWRVDEYNGSAYVKSPIWSFTTIPSTEIGDPDLVGWWKLDEGTGSTVVDSSGYGRHGTVIGDVDWADGYHGGALEFSNFGAYVDCGYDAADEVTGDFTLAAWAKLGPDTFANYGGVASKLDVSYAGFALVRHSSNYYRLYAGDENGGLSIVSSNVTYTDSDWHHLAGVHEDSTNVLYVDGVQQSEIAVVNVRASQERFVIGRQYNTEDSRYTIGKVDDVRIYTKALTDEEIATMMEGNPLLASDPMPGRGAVVDIVHADTVSWTAGDAAVSHNVYFGTNHEAVTNADTTSPEFQINQSDTSFSTAELVEFGGGDYYWRIDEVAADGTVQAGYVWTFTVPAYLIVDDFESYTNDSPHRLFQMWVDGLGFSSDDDFPNGHPGNGTGSGVGHDIWTGGSEHSNRSIAEVDNVHGGTQAMPIYYENSVSPFLSEATRTWATPQDWTTEGVTSLTLYVRGTLGNVAEQLYVVVQDSSGNEAVVSHPDATILSGLLWRAWSIPLADLTAAGVNTTAIKEMVIGIGSRTAPTAGGTGVATIDDVILE